MRSDQLSLEEINRRSSLMNVTFIGPYLGLHVKTWFRCDNGHEVERRPAHVFRGFKCPRCVRNERLTKEIVNERISYSGITLIEEYRGINTKVRFRCQNGHEWNTRPHSILQQKKGCPVCNTGTFSSSIPAHAYVLDFGDFIKYGITANLARRLEQHQTNGSYLIAKTKLFSKGIEAAEWENGIKSKYGGRYATKERCPDGYTETLPKSLMETILKTL